LQRAQDFVSDPQRSDQDLDAINRTERGVKNLQKAIHQAPDSPEKESLMKKLRKWRSVSEKPCKDWLTVFFIAVPLPTWKALRKWHETQSLKDYGGVL
ncbi:hypothetical protein HF669_12530, partial [Acidithiobacillus thiooxidans]|uniref:hypothetical protein n=2 Tax=Acidithiobacillaceae TaxID=225058 RepID=UPI001C069C63